MQHNVVENVKIAALQAIESAKPVAITYGTVTSAEPLKIAIDQKTRLGEKQLVRTRAVSKYTAKLTIDGAEKDVIIDMRLKVGEQVLLLRVQGGQKYIVLDRGSV